MYEIELTFGEEETIVGIYKEDDYIHIDFLITPETEFKSLFEKEKLSFLSNNFIQCFSSEEMFKEELKILKNVLKKDDFSFSNCRDISFSIKDYEKDFSEYLKMNPILREKDIHFSNFDYKTNHEYLDPLLELFLYDKQVLLPVEGNNFDITLEDYEKTVLKIDEITSKIKKYNLSLIEQIMYAYDLVRNRVYKREEKWEEIKTSRDLTPVLLGDKIVCEGYANIFFAVLTNLGISNRKLLLYGKGENAHSHVRNVAYVKDEKYDIDGVFYFDPTWDSKEDKNDVSYLNSYRYFCKTRNQMKHYDKNAYYDCTFGIYEEDIIQEFEKQLQKGEESISDEMISSINRVSRFIDGENILPTKEERKNPDIPTYQRTPFDAEKVVSCLERYNNLFFNQPVVEADTLMEVLGNVRKIEYYEDSTYPYSEESFKDTFLRKKNFSKEEMLLYRIFDNPIISDTLSKEEYESKKESMDLERTIEGVKFAKTLKKVVERRELEK